MGGETGSLFVEDGGGGGGGPRADDTAAVWRSPPRSSQQEALGALQARGWGWGGVVAQFTLLSLPHVTGQRTCHLG